MIDWTKPLEVFENDEWVAAKLDPNEVSPDKEGDYFLVKEDGSCLRYNAYLPSGEYWAKRTGSGVVVRNRTEPSPASEAKFTLPSDYELRVQAMGFAVRSGGSLMPGEILKFLKGEG